MTNYFIDCIVGSSLQRDLVYVQNKWTFICQKCANIKPLFRPYNLWRENENNH